MDIRKLQKIVVNALEDIKGKDIEVINTTKLTSLFDRLVIATGDSNRQVKALARNVHDKAATARHGLAQTSPFGRQQLFAGPRTAWLRLDLGDAGRQFARHALQVLGATLADPVGLAVADGEDGQLHSAAACSACRRRCAGVTCQSSSRL